jgi:hypothetical protein
MRFLALGLLTGASLAASTLPALAEPVTTRIETRPFYGATVTLEEGVRVFRPLPSHDRVIINPGGKTPLNLSFAETRETHYSESRNYFYDANGGGMPAYYGAWGNVLPNKGHGHHRHARRGGGRH